MRPEITSRIERRLDGQLGLWTRVLPWRHELVTHLEQAYEAARAEASSDEGAWRRVLEDFGDVQEVASQLRREHRPQHVAARIATVVGAAAIVFSMVRPLALFDWPAVGFVFGPALAFVLLDLARGSTRWVLANRIGAGAGACGAAFGAAAILWDLSDPRNVGASMAVSLLSALYCVLFFTPRWPLVAALCVIALTDFGLMLLAMDAMSAAEGAPIARQLCPPQSWQLDPSFIRGVLMLVGAGLGVGVARFGVHGVARHAPTVGAGVFLLAVIEMLGDMSDPARVTGGLLVALGGSVLAIAAGCFIGDSTRLARRLLR